MSLPKPVAEKEKQCIGGRSGSPTTRQHICFSVDFVFVLLRLFEPMCRSSSCSSSHLLARCGEPTLASPRPTADTRTLLAGEEAERDSESNGEVREPHVGGAEEKRDNKNAAGRGEGKPTTRAGKRLCLKQLAPPSGAPPATVMVEENGWIQCFYR